MLKLSQPPKVLVKALAALLNAGYANCAMTYSTDEHFPGWRVQVNPDPHGSVFHHGSIYEDPYGNTKHIGGAVMHTSIQGVLINAGLQTLEGWPRAKLTPCSNPGGEKCRYECACS